MSYCIGKKVVYGEPFNLHGLPIRKTVNTWTIPHHTSSYSTFHLPKIFTRLSWGRQIYSPSHKNHYKNFTLIILQLKNR